MQPATTQVTLGLPAIYGVEWLTQSQFMAHAQLALSC